MSNNNKYYRLQKAAFPFIVIAVGCGWLLHLATMQNVDVPTLPVEHHTTSTVMPLTQALQAPATPLMFNTGLEHLPLSLQGTEAPHGLLIDEHHQLLVTHTLREFFDYFLSALGEESLATIRKRVLTYMEKSLPTVAYQQAALIFEGYLNYRQALMQVPKAGGKPAEQLDIAAIQTQKEAEMALRSQYLSAEVSHVFFGDEDSYDRYTIARLKLQQDPNLSSSARQAQEQVLLAQLPAATQEALQTAQKLQSLQQLTDQCQRERCSNEQLQQQRVELVGAAAATRLALLDQQRAVWQNRVDHYLEQRTTILANNSYSDHDKQAQIQQLRASFSPQEQLRLTAFEQSNTSTLAHIP